MKQIVECVPNFSEGRDAAAISQITDAIRSVDGINLLDVDPGKATNRTVVTYVGSPEATAEAAFRSIKKAAEVIDMRHHHGEHPRIGATDVFPFVPVAGITLGECAAIARKVSERVGRELGIPVYCYEAAASVPERKNLAECRRGEYEGIAEKFGDPAWRPDFGPDSYTDSVARTGVSVIGARDFLVAVNFNLNTTSTRRANAVAYDVREKGRPKREGNQVTGKVLKDAEGKTVYVPGTLKGCKAIGWYIPEYGISQVSMNITDINATPLHIAFDEVCEKAAGRGMRVTGTEIVGLIPKRVLLDAGRYYLDKQHRSSGLPESEIIKIAVKSMSLDDLGPFDPRKKVIEYLIGDEQSGRLIDKTCSGFAYETASESPAPGGGSVSAYMGALGAALATMVANLSSHKPGWDDRWKEFSDYAVRGEGLLDKLLAAVDEDTAAFNGIMAAFSLPKDTPENRARRAKSIQEATLYATQVPLKTMKSSFEVFDLAKSMVEIGNPNSVSDAGVSAIAAWAAVHGAWLNVKINAASLTDRPVAMSLLAEAEAIARESDIRRDSILSSIKL